jgi:hypothetical protein
MKARSIAGMEIHSVKKGSPTSPGFDSHLMTGFGRKCEYISLDVNDRSCGIPDLQIEEVNVISWPIVADQGLRISGFSVYGERQLCPDGRHSG